MNKQTEQNEFVGEAGMRAALRMAIAFMETLNIDIGIKTWNEKHRKEVINACKEALQENELFWNTEQLEQAPVAFINVEQRTLEWNGSMYWHDWFTPTVVVLDKIPLYTRPTKPLSDDEIEKVWYMLYPIDSNNYWSDVLSGNHLNKFARAIEKAHGIGVKDE